MIFGLDNTANEGCPVDVFMTGMTVDTLTEEILIVGKVPASATCPILTSEASYTSAIIALYNN